MFPKLTVTSDDNEIDRHCWVSMRVEKIGLDRVYISAALIDAAGKVLFEYTANSIMLSQGNTVQFGQFIEG